MKVGSLRKISINMVFFILLLSCLTGCTTTLVAPYDEKLVTNTEEFYKKAAGIIEDGRAVSPRTDQERNEIANPAEHAGHFSKFEVRYNTLLIDAEALILRAMASSDEIDATGQQIQERLDQLIESNIPSVCESLAAEFGNTSLTAKNYIDLKCIITKWKERHANPQLTKNTLILKKANWEGRKKLIFNAILAIQTAEAFKKSDQQK